MRLARDTGPVRVGIIGLSANGGWAATAHIPALRALPDRFILAGLAASTSKSAAAAANAYGIAFATDDPAELVSRPDVDLIVIAVKVPLHKYQVDMAVASGKAVYCEWPLGRSNAEVKEMSALASKAGVPAFVGLQARSVPVFRYLRDLIAQGFIGEVCSSSIIGAGGAPWGGFASSGMAYATDETTGATMLSIPVGHAIDAVTWTLGEIEQLTAVLATRHRRVKLVDSDHEFLATGPDQVALCGALPNGALASLHYHGGDSAAAGFIWHIQGTNGELILEGESGHLQFGQVTLRGRQGSAAIQCLDVPANYRFVNSDPRHVSDGIAHAYHAIFEDIRLGTHLAPTFADALKNHERLRMIEQAAGWERETNR